MTVFSFVSLCCLVDDQPNGFLIKLWKFVFICQFSSLIKFFLIKFSIYLFGKIMGKSVLIVSDLVMFCLYFWRCNWKIDGNVVDWDIVSLKCCRNEVRKSRYEIEGLEFFLKSLKSESLGSKYRRGRRRGSNLIYSQTWMKVF